MKQDKKKLYESIMASIAKEVKKAINEGSSYLSDGYDEVINDFEKMEKAYSDFEDAYFKLKNRLRMSHDNNRKKALDDMFYEPMRKISNFMPNLKRILFNKDMQW